MTSSTQLPILSRTLICRAALLVSCIAALLGCSTGVESSTSAGQTVSSSCPNAFFNFGDSLSDTGNLALTMPKYSEANKRPYGMTFFGKPAGRYSNGRLVIDFILLAFKLPFLDPHLLPAAKKNTAHGVNFAYAGAAAAQDTYLVPQFLKFQVDQFVKLRNLAAAPHHKFTAPHLNLPEEANYKTALYTMCIGGNDVAAAFSRHVQFDVIFRDLIPAAVQEIANAVKTLYLQDARKFLIFNIPPEGCSVIFLSMLARSGLPKDSMGCITAVNEVNQAFNSGISRAVQNLRTSLPDVTITLFDYYSANMEILRDPSKYGFNPHWTQTACCGSPGFGTLNYNSKGTCGNKHFTTCDDPDQYINWDGTHFTDAFYRQIAKYVLNGEYSDPSTNLTAACNLSFDDFGHKTFDEVFLRSRVSDCDE